MTENSDVIKAQRQLWEDSFAEIPDMFGSDPSFAALQAYDFIKHRENARILELGAGQGRDAIFFARQGLNVTALDYAGSGLACIRKQAERLGLDDNLATICHDLTRPLPFADNSFDICFSHMLFCMALDQAEQKELAQEIRRVLTPGGVCIYSARNINDKHWRKGPHYSDNMYETDGFIVNFLDHERISDLAAGFAIIDICEFEEGELPRKLYLVKMQKGADRKVS